VTVVVLV